MSVHAEAEQFATATGLSLPNVLVELYAERGNGGFGPDYGLLGIVDGHKTDLGDCMLQLYQSFCESDPEDPGWLWPKNLVPFIHIGCAMHLCIDTAHPEQRVVLFDPNGSGPGEKLELHFKEESPSLAGWLERNV
jgi:hypothetical protein